VSQRSIRQLSMLRKFPLFMLCACLLLGQSAGIDDLPRKML
jgi:hypothetical protein